MSSITEFAWMFNINDQQHLNDLLDNLLAHPDKLSTHDPIWFPLALAFYLKRDQKTITYLLKQLKLTEQDLDPVHNRAEIIDLFASLQPDAYNRTIFHYIAWGGHGDWIIDAVKQNIRIKKNLTPTKHDSALGKKNKRGILDILTNSNNAVPTDPLVENDSIPLLNYNDKTEMTIAHFLAWGGDAQAIKKLVDEHGLNKDKQNIFGVSIGHYFAKHSLSALKAGVENNLCSYQDISPNKTTVFHYMLYGGNLDDFLTAAKEELFDMMDIQAYKAPLDLWEYLPRSGNILAIKSAIQQNLINPYKNSTHNANNISQQPNNAQTGKTVWQHFICSGHLLGIFEFLVDYFLEEGLKSPIVKDILQAPTLENQNIIPSYMKGVEPALQAIERLENTSLSELNFKQISQDERFKDIVNDPTLSLKILYQRLTKVQESAQNISDQDIPLRTLSQSVYVGLIAHLLHEIITLDKFKYYLNIHAADHADITLQCAKFSENAFTPISQGLLLNTNDLAKIIKICRKRYQSYKQSLSKILKSMKSRSSASIEIPKLDNTQTGNTVHSSPLSFFIDDYDGSPASDRKTPISAPLINFVEDYECKDAESQKTNVDLLSSPLRVNELAAIFKTLSKDKDCNEQLSIHQTLDASEHAFLLSIFNMLYNTPIKMFNAQTLAPLSQNPEVALVIILNKIRETPDCFAVCIYESFIKHILNNACMNPNTKPDFFQILLEQYNELSLYLNNASTDIIVSMIAKTTAKTDPEREVIRRWCDLILNQLGTDNAVKEKLRPQLKILIDNCDKSPNSEFRDKLQKIPNDLLLSILFDDLKLQQQSPRNMLTQYSLSSSSSSYTAPTQSTPSNAPTNLIPSKVWGYFGY